MGSGLAAVAVAGVRGVPIISALPTLLPPTSHFPLGNIKVQNAETWANSSLETCSGEAQAFSRPVHPRESKARSEEGQGSGAPLVDGTGEAG